VLLISAWYLINPGRCARSGYPLDDAWIHQSYARTLAQTGQVAFAPGRPSTGSTSLMWTFLLALGYMARLPQALWTYGLGALAWFLAAWRAQSLMDRLTPNRRRVVPWVTLACLLEWHLAWAALSGMEITLFCFLSLLLLERYAAGAGPLTLGLLGGLLVWARPEGLVLAALVLPAAALTRAAAPGRAPLPDPAPGHRTNRTRRAHLLLLVAGLAASLAPYLVLNLVISGQPFPSTLYAKQAEYRILLDQPIWQRLWVVVRRPLVGAQVLLLPGFVWQVYVLLRQALLTCRSRRAFAAQESRERPARVRTRALAALLPPAWWAAYHGLYALQLPVDYQHGRYLMPALPILLAYGTTGTLHWLGQATEGGLAQRPFTRVWTRALAGTLAVLYLAFLVLGAQAYVTDRCIIQREMVQVALWLAEKTPPDVLIAAHDIGAIGYWAQRPLLDLAGLINPEVIPFMQDQDRLLEYVIGQQAYYLVTFPSWYPELVRDDRLTQVYPAQGQAAPPAYGESMTVYQVGR